MEEPNRHELKKIKITYGIRSAGKATERGEVLKFFSQRMGWPIPRVARQLMHLKDIGDLYYLKSECLQAESRGIPFGAAFWTAIKPKEDTMK